MFMCKIFNPNVPLTHRACQFGNVLLEWACGGPLGIVHVIEFPKCGGSWVRNMIRTYIGSDLFLGGRLLRKNDVVLAHRLFSPRFRRPVVVMRDPRDMYVSFYHFQTSYQSKSSHSPLFKYYRHDAERSVQEDFCEYLKAKFLYPSHPWFYYSQFLDSWLNRPRVCVVRYEDLLVEPETQLIRILRFLNVSVDLNQVGETVLETSFEAITRAKYGESRKAGKEDNTKFHRKGVAGDWKNHFNENSCRLFERFEGPSLRRLNYESDSGWIKTFLNNHS